MLVELTTTRLLAPWFGASIYCWTNVIAVVLLCLAAGYAAGGRLADRRPEARLLGWLLVVGALLLVPAPFLGPWLSPKLMPAPELSDPTSATGSIVIGSFAATLLLFGAPLILLGCVCPFLTRLLSDHGAASGGAAGRILCWSTLGSLLGTYLPAHVLLEHLGSRGTILAASGTILLAGVIVMTTVRGRATAAAGMLFVLGIAPAASRLPFVAPVGNESILRELESPYQYVRIARWPADGGRPASVNLSLDEGTTEFHSRRLEDESGLTNAYYDYLAVLPDWIADSDRNPIDVLDIGGAAGTLRGCLRRFQNSRVRAVTDVEIDAVVAGLALQFGGAVAVPDRVIVADGRTALSRLSDRFDLIVLDAYTRQLAIPAHLATAEAFRSMKERLTPRGILALNVSVADLQSPLCRALAGTLGEAFPAVWSVSVEGSWNVVMIAGALLPPNESPVARGDALDPTRHLFRKSLHRLDARAPYRRLTDDCAPLETLAREIR